MKKWSEKLPIPTKDRRMATVICGANDSEDVIDIVSQDIYPLSTPFEKLPFYQMWQIVDCEDTVFCDHCRAVTKEEMAIIWMENHLRKGDAGCFVSF